MDKFTEIIKIILGGIVTAVSGFFGGMDGIMFALIAFISIDYVTGVAVAVKQKNYPQKSDSGVWCARSASWRW